eukprot:16442622-Heterocapsa_arctica.AAC.1
MRSSVLQFNRLPALAAVVARRMGGAVTGPYVDGFTTMVFLAASGSAQSFANHSIRTLGDQL